MVTLNSLEKKRLVCDCERAAIENSVAWGIELVDHRRIAAGAVFEADHNVALLHSEEDLLRPHMCILKDMSPQVRHDKDGRQYRQNCGAIHMPVVPFAEPPRTAAEEKDN